MSDAQEPDLVQYLEVRRAELETALHDSRNRVLAEASMRGTIGSGGTAKLGIGGMEQTFSDYVTDLASAIGRWAGERLPERRVREIVAGHLKQAVEDLATAETACGVAGRAIRGDALRALNGIVAQAKTRILARVREFELGADRDRNPRPTSVTNIVHARDIVGGIQQAGGDAVQANSVNLSAESIGVALEHLMSQVLTAAPSVAAEIEPDAVTVRSQLSKSEPNSVIVQEAGRSIRTVIEGAAGGVIGNALTPGVVHALAAFLAAIGLG